MILLMLPEGCFASTLMHRLRSLSLDCLQVTPQALWAEGLPISMDWDAQGRLIQVALGSTCLHTKTFQAIFCPDIRPYLPDNRPMDCVDAHYYFTGWLALWLSFFYEVSWVSHAFDHKALMAGIVDRWPLVVAEGIGLRVDCQGGLVDRESCTLVFVIGQELWAQSYQQGRWCVCELPTSVARLMRRLCRKLGWWCAVGYFRCWRLQALCPNVQHYGEVAIRSPHWLASQLVACWALRCQTPTRPARSLVLGGGCQGKHAVVEPLFIDRSLRPDLPGAYVPRGS